MLNHTRHVASRTVSGATAAGVSLRTADSVSTLVTSQRLYNTYASPPTRRPRLRPTKASQASQSSPTLTWQKQAIRRSTTDANPGNSQPYEALVVGAGPAGITCMGTLLERQLPGPILWVDDGFDGGRVNRRYREVPSNTKVGLFIDFATAVEPFRQIVGESVPKAGEVLDERSDGSALARKEDKLKTLRELDPQKGCQLSYAADMMLMLTEGLRKMKGVVTDMDRVTEAVLDEQAGMWDVRVGEAGQSVRTKRLVLCTGASPNENPLPVEIPGVQMLGLDTALAPTLLRKSIPSDEPTTVAVIGASHSAILVLMNLINLARTSNANLRIRWLTRHELRYAQYMDGWVLRDNTGLKGEAAAWAKANLEPEVFDQSEAGKYIEKVSYEKGAEKETLERSLPGCSHVVQAIGYHPDQTPVLRTNGGKGIVPIFDHETGAFQYDAGTGKKGALEKLQGLFGAGIAWPERVTDPHGNVEYAVGFWKFMKMARKSVPQWD